MQSVESEERQEVVRRRHAVLAREELGVDLVIMHIERQHGLALVVTH